MTHQAREVCLVLMALYCIYDPRYGPIRRVLVATSVSAVFATYAFEMRLRYLFAGLRRRLMLRFENSERLKMFEHCKSMTSITKEQGIICGLALGVIVLGILYNQQTCPKCQDCASDPEILSDDYYSSQFSHHCNMRCQPQSDGTVPQGGGEIGESINSTKTACAAMCAQDPNCTSWQWHKNADTPNCALSNVCTLDDLGDDDGFDAYIKK